MSLLKPCLDCGLASPETRCPDCAEHDPRGRGRVRASPEARGYDREFVRLRTRALKMQPWCLACQWTGSAENPLSLDHTERAWERRAQGKRIRLQDVNVLCRSCNSRKGSARKSVG